MPWRCPACRSAIQHNEIESRPRPGVVYRCYVCRLELVLNENTDYLDVTAMRTPAPRERTVTQTPAIPDVAGRVSKKKSK
jgi:hypothetical protein